MAPNQAPARRTPSGARAKRTAARETEDLEAQVQQLQHDLHSITQTLTHMGERRVEQVKSTAKAQAEGLLHRGHSVVEGAQDEFTQLEKQLKDTIRDKPLTAVAGALALGFLLAVLTR
jgi:ElaB/YqjD/DUF883 family membrane-anchored ribosome-binding protein